MVAIGAFIGGLTNFIAIKMLFRPHEAIKLGKWQLPFTPGLIPRRRDEIAVQLGNMVVDYLLTPDGLTKKFKSSSFVSGLTSWLQKEVKAFLHSERTLQQVIVEKFGVKQPRERMLQTTETFLSNKYDQFFERNRGKSLDECLPDLLIMKIETNIPSVATYILERGRAFIESSKGKEQLSAMIERFLGQKGKLGSMISMFLSQERLVDVVQPELMKFLHQQETHQLLENLLTEEWHKYKQKNVAEIEQLVNKVEVMKLAMEVVEKELPFYEWVQLPFKEWAPRYERVLTDSIIPSGVEALLDLAATHMGTLMKQLHLHEVVTEQVKAFSTKRLEELVISIAKRELKMITYLGALLGGVIGFIQSLLVMMTT